MVLYALEDVDDAFDVTRSFLADLDRTSWVKLAVVVFFIGSAGGGFPTGNVPVGGDGGMGPGGVPAGEFPAFDPGPDVWLLVGAVVLALALLGLALFLVSSVMEFVFVESLRTQTVSIREYWGRYWRQGVRLFAFRLAVGVFGVAAFLLLGAAFVLPFVFDAAVGASLLLLLALLPVFFVLAVLLGLINGFTTAFVVPIMLVEGCGVLEGWQRLWPTVRAEWTQYLAYAVAAFVLSLAGGIFVFVVGAVLVLVLLVPFGVLFAVGAGLLSVAQPVGVGWLVVTGVLFALAALFALALAQVPVQTYLRYYALLVLGDVESSFDLIPGQRAVAREPDESAEGV